MAKHLWSVCCERAIIDQVTGKVSLIDVVEGLMVPPQTEVAPMQLVLASLWVRDEGETGTVELECRFTWRGPDDEALEDKTVKAEISAGKQGTRTIFTMVGVRLKGTGQHHFRVEERSPGAVDFEHVKDIPVDVRPISLPAQ